MRDVKRGPPVGGYRFGKTMKAVRVVANAGLAIVGDPTTAARQDDLLTLGLSTVLDVTTTIALVAEYNGRMNLADRSPIPGAENRGVARAGVRVTRGSLRLDTAALFGATTSDLDIGATAGLTWIFRAFSLP